MEEHILATSMAKKDVKHTEQAVPNVCPIKNSQGSGSTIKAIPVQPVLNFGIFEGGYSTPATLECRKASTDTPSSVLDSGRSSVKKVVQTTNVATNLYAYEDRFERLIKSKKENNTYRVFNTINRLLYGEVLLTLKLFWFLS